MFEQERVIGRLQRYVSTVPEIRVAFLSGSFGRRASDDYSDIDVVYVFADEAAREKAWARRQELAQSIMPYVALKSYDAVEERPYLQVVLFANGSLLKIRYETMGALQPNPWDSQIRILKDDGDWAREFVARSTGLAKPQPLMTGSTLQEIDDRFWVMLWDVLRLIARGNVDKPFPTYLEMLHGSLPPLLQALPPAHPAHAALVQVSYSRDAAATAVHLLRLLNAYEAAREAIITEYHLQLVANQPFEREILRLLERMV